MPGLNEILSEINAAKPVYEAVRRKYLRQLSELTGRNVIAYYSGWLQKNQGGQTSNQIMSINDVDKTGFMSTICKLDRKKGLDIILHTPGGGVSATESLIEYLQDCFGDDIRAIVPQLAMSGGTMIACGCNSIVMGRPSSLGPVDPQIGGISVSGILEEFDRVRRDIQKDPNNIMIWQPILNKYPPSFVGDCEKAAKWANEILRDNLTNHMLKNDPDQKRKVNRIVRELGDHAKSKSHSRHFSKDTCKQFGLAIEDLEADQEFQDAVLSIHHAYTLTFFDTTALKIIENQNGAVFIQHAPISVANPS